MMKLTREQLDILENFLLPNEYSGVRTVGRPAPSDEMKEAALRQYARTEQGREHWGQVMAILDRLMKEEVQA